MKPTSLSIIIVNWNSGNLLSKCIESIKDAEPRITFDILVVDNASTDESISLLRRSTFSQTMLASGQLRIVENSENVGFGRANNQAFALTQSPFVFLLNPDATIHSGAIDILLDTVQSNAKIAGCGPKILNEDGSTQTSVFFNPPQAWHTFFWQLKLYLLLPRKLRGSVLLGHHWDHSTQRDVPMLIGAAFLVRREVIEQVGGFNESFHMYGEDNEWCWRIRRAEWRLIFNPAAVVTHIGGHSAGKRWTPDDQKKIQLESNFKFEQLALSKWSLVANRIASYLVTSTQVVARRLWGIDPGQLEVVQKSHWKHLMLALKENRDESDKDPTHRGASA